MFHSCKSSVVSDSPTSDDLRRLRLIGYWAHPDHESRWPDPRRFIDEAWDSEQRALVAGYLQRGLVARLFMGPARCRLCGRGVGNEEWSDGVFIWPEGLGHYVEEHSVRLPQEFIDHVEGHLTAFDDLEIDADWWTQVTGGRESDL